MVEEYAAYSSEVNQKFLCITDHGALGAIPRQIKAAEHYNLKPIFGCELYYNPIQPEVPAGMATTDFTADMDQATKDAIWPNYHLLALAYTNQGYSNLVQLSSWAWLKGYYRRPRVNYETLMKYKEGLIFTSCCYMSEIGQAFDAGGDEAGFAVIEKYRDMFGENFYLEIMLLDFKKQKPYDAFIIRAHDKYGIPIIVSQDCHYCRKEDSIMQRLMLMVQTGKTIQDMQAAIAENADMFELQDENLWMKSEEEINAKWRSDYMDVIPWEILQQAKKNTVTICEKAKGVSFDRAMKLPQLPDDKEKLRELMIAGFDKRRLPKNRVYLDRLKEEYHLICKKGYASYFLIQKMMTDEARRICPILLGFGDGSEALGPGRGSGGGSLINYCLGVTDVDPIEYDLLFSRFLSPARGGLQMKTRFKNKPLILPPREPDSVVGIEAA